MIKNKRPVYRHKSFTNGFLAVPPARKINLHKFVLANDFKKPKTEKNQFEAYYASYLLYYYSITGLLLQ